MLCVPCRRHCLMSLATSATLFSVLLLLHPPTAWARPTFDLDNRLVYHDELEERNVDGDPRHIRLSLSETKVLRAGDKLPSASASLEYDLIVTEDAMHGINFDREKAVETVECLGAVDTAEGSVTLRVHVNADQLASDDEVVKRLHAGAIVNGGPEWGCLGKDGAPSMILRRVVKVAQTKTASPVTNVTVLELKTTFLTMLDLIEDGSISLDMNKVRGTKKNSNGRRSKRRAAGTRPSTVATEPTTIGGDNVTGRGRRKGVPFTLFNGPCDNCAYSPGATIRLQWSTSYNCDDKIHITLYHENHLGWDKIIEEIIVTNNGEHFITLPVGAEPSMIEYYFYFTTTGGGWWNWCYDIEETESNRFFVTSSGELLDWESTDSYSPLSGVTAKCISCSSKLDYDRDRKSVV